MDGASPFTLRKKYVPKIRRVSKLFQTTKMAQVRKGLDEDKLLFVNVFAKASTPQPSEYSAKICKEDL